MQKLDQITTEMIEYICGTLCINHQKTKTQEELEEICSECQMGGFLMRLLAEEEEYSGIALCQECKYRKDDNDCCGTDFSWCRGDGLDGHLKETDGCSRGKRKGTI